MKDAEIIETMRLYIHGSPAQTFAKGSEVHQHFIIGLLARLVFAGEWRAKSGKSIREFIEAEFAKLVRDPTDPRPYTIEVPISTVAGPEVFKAFRLAAEALR